MCGVGVFIVLLILFIGIHIYSWNAIATLYSIQIGSWNAIINILNDTDDDADDVGLILQFIAADLSTTE